MRLRLSVLGFAILVSAAGCESSRSAQKTQKSAPVATPAKAGTEWEVGQPIAGATAVPLAELAGRATALADKPVRVEGTVTGVCQHRGCWIEISDGTNKVIAKSIDHSVAFPRDSVGKRLVVEGPLRVGAAPTCEGGHEMHKGDESHQCPSPEVMVVVSRAELRPAS